MSSNKLLGELLVRDNLISQAQLQQAFEEQKKKGGRLGANLTRLGFIAEEDLVNFLSKQYEVPSINLADFEIDPEIISMVPEEQARKHVLIPINRAGATLVVAMADPSNIFAQSDIEFLTGFKVEVVVARESQIVAALERHVWEEEEEVIVYGVVDYDPEEDEAEEILLAYGVVDPEEDAGGDVAPLNSDDGEEASFDRAVARLVNLIIADAFRKGAAAILMEPYQRSFRIRFRIDGIFHEVMKPPLKLKDEIPSLIKTLAVLDVAETRLPQSGSIKVKVEKGVTQTLAVSTYPVAFGEAVVIKVLTQAREYFELSLEKLGFEPGQLEMFRQALTGGGMVVVSGPTFAGKHTTLYSALIELCRPDVNIMTAEAPIRYHLDGVNQIMLDWEIGLGFSSALRAIIRANPDVIYLGEIMDFDTAELAARAAISGSLVMAAIHTNDSASIPVRLFNMGVEPYILNSALKLAMAQRTVRKLCPECKQPDETRPEVLVKLEIDPDLAGAAPFFAPGGCHLCNDTGFNGLTGVFELLPMRDWSEEFIIDQFTHSEIKGRARKLGMRTLRQSAFARAAEGITSIQEAIMKTPPD